MAGTLTLLRWYRNAMGELVAGPGGRRLGRVPWALGPEDNHSQSCCEHGEAGENSVKPVPPREGQPHHSSQGNHHVVFRQLGCLQLCPGLSTSRQRLRRRVSGGPGSQDPCSLGQGTPGIADPPSSHRLRPGVHLSSALDVLSLQTSPLSSQGGC